MNKLINKVGLMPLILVALVVIYCLKYGYARLFPERTDHAQHQTQPLIPLPSQAILPFQPPVVGTTDQVFKINLATENPQNALKQIAATTALPKLEAGKEYHIQLMITKDNEPTGQIRDPANTHTQPAHASPAQPIQQGSSQS
ncbi:MAG: hypothetical protein KGM99_13160 [Burkholderiales bacterium]|nr:hypothetical protein [Burkholderiales bacterium]